MLILGNVKPLHYSNQDLELENVITPVMVDKLVQLLKQSNYCEHETQFLETGFSQGFDIEYHGPVKRQSVSENIPFSVGDEVDLWNKLMKKVKQGRVAEPFETIPFENFIQSLKVGDESAVKKKRTCRSIFLTNTEIKRHSTCTCMSNLI